MKNLIIKLVIVFTFIIIEANCQNVQFISGYISYTPIVGTCVNPSYSIELTLNTKYRKIPLSFLNTNGAGSSPFVFMDSITVGNNIIKSKYQKSHVYPGCGNWTVNTFDTSNVQIATNINLNNRLNFYISSDIIISNHFSPITSSNHFFSPATTIYKNKDFKFNPIALTQNSLIYDSLIHTLITSINATDFQSYIPSGVKINRCSGEIQWINSDTIGSYIFMVQTSMYKGGRKLSSAKDSYKFDVVNQTPSFTMDSINKIPVNNRGFKEINYDAGNTYTFSAVYSDPVADSVKLFSYPIDFFDTAPTIAITQNTIRKNTLNFSWSPVTADERLYPYNFVLNSRSYYPNDSVANSYETVSFKSLRVNGLNEAKTLGNIKIFPNPTYDILNILYKASVSDQITIEVINLLGQKVYSANLGHQTDVSTNINTANFAAGVYKISIIGNKTLANKLFVKQ